MFLLMIAASLSFESIAFVTSVPIAVFLFWISQVIRSLFK
jgi:hypothetical protein